MSDHPAPEPLTDLRRKVEAMPAALMMGVNVVPKDGVLRMIDRILSSQEAHPAPADDDLTYRLAVLEEAVLTHKSRNAPDVHTAREEFADALARYRPREARPAPAGSEPDPVAFFSALTAARGVKVMSGWHWKDEAYFQSLPDGEHKLYAAPVAQPSPQPSEPDFEAELLSIARDLATHCDLPEMAKRITRALAARSLPPSQGQQPPQGAKEK